MQEKNDLINYLCGFILEPIVFYSFNYKNIQNNKKIKFVYSILFHFILFYFILLYLSSLSKRYCFGTENGLKRKQKGNKGRDYKFHFYKVSKLKKLENDYNNY